MSAVVEVRLEGEGGQMFGEGLWYVGIQKKICLTQILRKAALKGEIGFLEFHSKAASQTLCCKGKQSVIEIKIRYFKPTTI